MKKILSLILVVFIAFPSVLYAGATETENVVYYDATTVTAGQTICVPIKISNNTGLMGFSIKITYDRNTLHPVSTQRGDVISSGLFNDNIDNATPGSFKAVWTGTEEIDEDGMLFNVIFEVSNSASGSKNLTISYNQADTFDENWNDVILNCVSGNITIENSTQPTEQNIVGSIDCNAMAGDTFDLPIIFENTAALMGFGIEITYDSTVITPVSVIAGEVFTGGFLNDNAQTAGGRLKVLWTGNEDTVGNGTAFYVRFSVNADAPQSQQTIGISCVQEDTFNELWQDVVLNCSDVTITVSVREINCIYSEMTAAVADDMFTVPVKIKNNTGFMGYSLRLEYDKDVLNPISVSAGEGVTNGMLNDSIEYSLNRGRSYFNVIWTGDEEFTTDETLFYVTFAVNQKLSDRTTINVSYSQDDTFDSNYNDVVMNCNPIEILFSGTIEPKFFTELVTAVSGEMITVPVRISDYESLTSFTLNALIPMEYFTFVRAEGEVTAVATGNNVTIAKIGSTPLDNEVVFSLVLQVAPDVYGDAEITLSVVNSSNNASADNIHILVSSPITTNPTVFSQEAVSAVDRTLVVPVQLENNCGIMGLGINIGYDSEILILKSITRGSVLDSGLFDTNLGFVQPGSCKVIWNSTEDTTENGTLFTLEFEVSPSAKESYTEITLTYSQPDTYNEKWEDVELNTESVCVTINRLTISRSNSNIYKGDMASLTALYTSVDSSPTNIVWKSENTSIATVNSNGTVTAERYGNVRITATDEYGNIAELYLQIFPVVSTVEIVNLSGKNDVKVNWWKKYSSATMQLSFSVSNCEEAVRYVWSSDNSKVQIDEHGSITNTGSFARSATITLTAYDANENVVAKTSIKVSFYKFSWQQSRLQSQEFVGDDYNAQQEAISPVMNIISVLLHLIDKALPIV